MGLACGRTPQGSHGRPGVNPVFGNRRANRQRRFESLSMRAMKRRKTAPGRPTNRPTPIQCARVRKASRHDIGARAQHGRSADKGDDGSTIARRFDWRGQSRRPVPMQCKNPRTADSHAFAPGAWRQTLFNVFEAVQCVSKDRKARAISTNFDKIFPIRRNVRPHCGRARAWFNLSHCCRCLERADSEKPRSTVDPGSSLRGQLQPGLGRKIPRLAATPCSK